jgi:hypothetical protein
MHGEGSGRATGIQAGLVWLRRLFVRDTDLWLVPVDIDAVQVQTVCARCLQPASCYRSEVLASAGKTLKIPYCQDCTSQIGQRAVKRLGWVLAALLLGVAGCLFFPLVPWLSPPAAVLGSMALASVPWLIWQVLWLRMQTSGQRTLAAMPSAEGVLCTNADFALQLSASHGVQARRQRIRQRVNPGWSLVGLAVAGFVTPQLYDLFHCEVRIVNLTEEDVTVAVDGRPLAITQATTQEHPLAGSLVRIPSGSRLIQARHRNGGLVHEAQEEIAAGQTYLYAPGHPSSVCFWVERTPLGREPSVPAYREALAPHLDFWQLPVAIDAWFTPVAGPKSEVFTGGVVAALRQGPCDSKGSRPAQPALHF